MLHSAFSKALYTVCFFLANLLLANLLLPVRFGAVSLLIVNAAILHLITGLGADSIIVHSLTNRKWNLSHAASFALYASLLQLVVFLMLEGLHLQIWHSTLLAQNDGRLLPGEIFYFIGLVATERSVALLYSENKAVVANRMLLLSVVVYMAALLIVKLRQMSAFHLLFYVFCLQSLLQGCLLWAAFCYKERSYHLVRLRWSALYAVFKISSVAMLTNFIQFLAYRIDFLLLKTFYSDYEVGLYAQANKFANLMWVIPNIFALLLMPKFRTLEGTKVTLVFRGAVVSGVALLLLTTITTGFFYAYGLRPEYKTGLAAFYLMLPGYFCWSVVIYFGAYFSWRGLFYNNLLLSSFCFILVLVCDLWLIPGRSLQGAAIANSLAYSVTLLVCLVLFSRATGIGILKIFELQKDDFSQLLKLLK